MLSPRSDLRQIAHAGFFRNHLLPLGKKEEFGDVNIIINACDNPAGGERAFVCFDYCDCISVFCHQMAPCARALIRFLCVCAYAGKYCTEHHTTNYPNVKYFRADEDGDQFE